MAVASPIEGDSHSCLEIDRGDQHDDAWEDDGWSVSLLNGYLGLGLATRPEYISSTDHRETALLNLYRPDPGGVDSEATAFEPQHIADSDVIEARIHPPRKTLVDLYSRIVHASFPIPDKGVLLTKNAVFYRMFAPPLPAAVTLSPGTTSSTIRLPIADGVARPANTSGQADLKKLAERTVADDLLRPKPSTCWPDSLSCSDAAPARADGSPPASTKWLIQKPGPVLSRRNNCELNGNVSKPAETERPLRLSGGFPFSIGDNIDAVGFLTTAGCLSFAGAPAAADSPAVANLQAADAVLISTTKTSLDLFATGAVGTRSPYEIVPNVFDPSYRNAATVLRVAEGFDEQGLYARKRPEEPTAGSNQSPKIAICAKPRSFAQLLYEGPCFAEQYVLAIRDFVEKAWVEDMDPVVPQALIREYRRPKLAREIGIAFAAYEAILVPTSPTFTTIEEAAREPVVENSILGAYTNYVNFMNWTALSIPAAFRSDWLPYWITLNRQSRWFTILDLGVVSQVVVGAHLSGFSLSRDLATRGAKLNFTATTSANDRLFAPEKKGATEKPGLRRVASSEPGAEIEAEVWRLPKDQLPQAHTARAAASAVDVPVFLRSDRLLSSTDEALVAAGAVGFSIMLKSIPGGDNIGLERCDDAAALKEALERVQRVADAKFGDSANTPEKVLEECPAPNLAKNVRASMREAAESLAAVVSYRNLRTAEFIYNIDTEEFYFLEVNT
ncbi:amidase signature domain-containing protein [Xylariaceae sp. FL0662B]|nr:amidase signature domain-containing protein [Xylariaceae sp. FL0662B]